MKKNKSLFIKGQFKNKWGMTEQDIYLPILLHEKVVGMVTKVTKKKVQVCLWGDFFCAMYKLDNGQPLQLCSIDIIDQKHE